MRQSSIRSRPPRRRPPGPRPRRTRAGSALVLAVALALLVPVPAHASDEEDEPPPRWSASVDQQEVARAGTEERVVETGDPVRFSPDEPAVVSVTVEGRPDSAVDVERVRIEGNVLGMTFFAYTTRVDLRAEPGGQDTRRFSLDLWDLQGQATGLIPARIVLLEGREEVASRPFPVRVEGSLSSVYGAFGLAVGALTLLVLWGALWSLATGRLHGNRWRRGTAFAVPGLGVGLTLTFTVSALGWLLPSATAWLPLVLVCGGIGFAAGYVSPTPDDDLGADDEADPDAGEEPGDDADLVPATRYDESDVADDGGGPARDPVGG